MAGAPVSAGGGDVGTIAGAWGKGVGVGFGVGVGVGAIVGVGLGVSVAVGEGVGFCDDVDCAVVVEPQAARKALMMTTHRTPTIVLLSIGPLE